MEKDISKPGDARLLSVIQAAIETARQAGQSKVIAIAKRSKDIVKQSNYVRN